MSDFKREVFEALLQAYPDQESLENFLYVKMDVELSRISSPKNNLTTTIRLVIHWAISGGRSGELIRSASEDQRGNVRLAALVERLIAGETLDLGIGEDDEYSVGGRIGIATLPQTDRKAPIRTLLQGLDGRKDLFRYLNAYKELHETMHELHRSRPRILATVHSRVNDPSLPLADDVVESLEEWIAKGKEWSSETEFPDRPPDWIARLQTALAILTDSDPGRWEWALERLESTPAREMSRLNDRLVDNASRLKCQELAEHSDAILIYLQGKQSPEINDVAKRVEQFRNQCIQLSQLVEIHNQCQRIDELLGEAAGLPEVSAANLMEWPEVMTRMKELKDSCVGNRKVCNTYDAALQFAGAKSSVAAATEFSTLQEHFDDLFHVTDKELLKVSNRIGNSVFGLASKLRGML